MLNQIFWRRIYHTYNIQLTTQTFEPRRNWFPERDVYEMLAGRHRQPHTATPSKTTEPLFWTLPYLSTKMSTKMRFIHTRLRINNAVYRYCGKFYLTDENGPSFATGRGKLAIDRVADGWSPNRWRWLACVGLSGTDPALQVPCTVSWKEFKAWELFTPPEFSNPTRYLEQSPKWLIFPLHRPH